MQHEAWWGLTSLQENLNLLKNIKTVNQQLKYSWSHLKNAAYLLSFNITCELFFVFKVLCCKDYSICCKFFNMEEYISRQTSELTSVLQIFHCFIHLKMYCFEVTSESVKESVSPECFSRRQLGCNACFLKTFVL